MIDENIIYVIEYGIIKFDDYYKLIKSNDIYFIATILDPRIKTQWIKDYLLDEANMIIKRVKTFLKNTYP